MVELCKDFSWGWILFNIFMNDLGTKQHVAEACWWHRLGRRTMQRELDDLEDWINSKEMKSSSEKCKVTSLRSNKSFYCRDSPSVDDKGEKHPWDRLWKKKPHLPIPQEEFLSGEGKYARNCGILWIILAPMFLRCEFDLGCLQKKMVEMLEGKSLSFGRGMKERKF